MNVSSVSYITNYTSQSNSNEIRLLEKQKLILEQQLQIIENSKEDSKTKQEKIKLIQVQLQQLDVQIQQKQMKNSEESSNNVQAVSEKSTVNNFLYDKSGNVEKNNDNASQERSRYKRIDVLV